MKIFRILFIFIFSISLFVSSCSQPLKTIRRNPLQCNADEIRSEILARVSSIKSLRLKTNVKITKDSGHVIMFPVDFSIRMPGELRADILGPFLEIEGFLIIKDGMFLSVSVPEKIARAGAANQSSMVKFLGLPIDPAILVSALGGMPQALKVQKAGISISGSCEEALLTATDGASEENYFISLSNLALRKVVLGKPDGSGPSITLTLDWTNAGTDAVLKKITAKLDGKPGNVEIRYQENEQNVEIKESEFNMDVPAGFKFE